MPARKSCFTCTETMLSNLNGFFVYIRVVAADVPVRCVLMRFNGQSGARYSRCAVLEYIQYRKGGAHGAIQSSFTQVMQGKDMVNGRLKARRRTDRHELSLHLEPHLLLPKSPLILAVLAPSSFLLAFKVCLRPQSLAYRGSLLLGVSSL